MTTVAVIGTGAVGATVAAWLIADPALNVVLCARTADMLDEVVREIKTSAGTAAAIAMDLRDPEAGTRLVDFAVKTFGSLDIVDANSKTLKTMQWETGKAYWLGIDPAGQQHGDLNRGTEPIEVIVVELKNDVK